MHVSFLSIANFLVTVSVKSGRANENSLVTSKMSNYLKKLTENTSFGTTELCKYCGLSILCLFDMSTNNKNPLN